MRVSEAGLALIRRTGAGGPAEYLTQWSDKWARFALVGGHVEPGESFRECCVREVAEELGLVAGVGFRVAPEAVAPVCEYRAVSGSAGVETIYRVQLFAVELLAPEAEAKVNADAMNRWLTEPEIRRLLTASDRKPVAAQVETVFVLAGVIPKDEEYDLLVSYAQADAANDGDVHRDRAPRATTQRPVGAKNVQPTNAPTGVPVIAHCPTCNEILPASGRCEACLLVSSILLNGNDPAASVAGPAPDDDFEEQVSRPLSPETLAFLNQEFLPPATEFPHPLPPPLADPLRVLGWYVLGSFVLVAALGLWTVWSDNPTDEAPPFVVSHGVWIASACVLFSIWRLLPHRRTDVLYLRSFRHDENTSRVRADLIRAFGRGFRISGIRDPGQRSIKWLRQLNALVFALRYATPKYLNLEAEDDWKLRLWRSLTLARAAVIDVTDLTSYVKDEVRMCYRTLGLDRVLFVGSTARTADEWRALIASILELPGEAPIRVAVWSEGRTLRAKFQEDASAYARQLPKRPPELSPAGSEVAYQGYTLDGPIADGLNNPWAEVIVGGILVGLLTTGLALLREQLGIGTALVILPVALWMILVQVGAFLTYLGECGTAREQVLVSLTMGLSFPALFAAGLAPGVWSVQLAVARMRSSNNLKQMSIAMHSYESEKGRLPAVMPDKEGPPQLSWRVLILPYIGQRELYERFNLDEPWDSPHNLRFVEAMPAVYRHPNARKTPPGHTYYCVFFSPTGTNSPSAVFRRGREGPRLVGISDGTSDTLLIIEAKEAIPWTKPDELEYDANKPLPKLGGHYPGVFLVAFADGSVRPLPTDLPEKTLRALITANGGEKPD